MSKTPKNLTMSAGEKWSVPDFSKGRATIVTAGAGTEHFRAALMDHAAEHEMMSDFPEPAGYTGVYQDRRRGAGYALYESLDISRDDRVARHNQLMENFRFSDAPHVAVVTSARELGIYGAVDCGSYISTFLLAAEVLESHLSPRLQLRCILIRCVNTLPFQMAEW